MEKLVLNDKQEKQEKHNSNRISNFEDVKSKIKKYYDEVETNYLYSKPELKEYYSNNYLNYGTSGFRYKYNILDIVALRLPIVCYLRSISLGLPIGITITASHNLAEDNGFKIAELLGKSLDFEWEKWSEKIINSKNFINDVIQLIDDKLVDYQKCKIIIGYDTRKTSKHFTNLIKLTLNILECPYIDYEEQTTPQVHFLTFLSQQEILDYNNYKKIAKYINEGKETHFHKSVYFDCFYETTSKAIQLLNKICDNNKKFYERELQIDCSNGVVGIQDNIIGISKILKELFGLTVEV